jgi:adenylate cyclase
MAELTIRLLGPFRVTIEDAPITDFETEKSQALLAYLAVEAGRPHRRARLAEMLWPDRPEGAARANLRHALASLRRAIGDPQAAPPFLLATRQTIQFNDASDAWVDTEAFLKSLEGKTPHTPPPVRQLEDAVGLYRGGFLEDISIADSAAFHEWVLLKREQFRRQASNALCGLAKCYEIWGMFERALEHAWRQVELEPWDEQAHRQVMRLLAFSGQRGTALAQYEACCRLLAEELGVEPEMETTELFERIRDEELEIPPLIQEPPLIFQPPDFLEEKAEAVEPPVFVAREWELARLGSFLEQALKGHGCVVFVAGGAGQGKTALLGEFARRAMDAHPNLLVARGECSAYAGVGDPYLPFRDVMAMLTGDLQARWAAGSIRRDHARRLWDALPLMTQALLAHGVALIGPILAGDALLSRAAAALPARVDELERLHALTGRARSGTIDLEQSFLFEQYTHVLHALAERHPLILVLDDVQWADNASIGLLFHLGRRLAGSRILIACAYRPEEVAWGRTGPSARQRGEPVEPSGQARRHPLEKVLCEFKRTFGDVWVDLDRVEQSESRRFVDAFLDTEPNRLGEGFRAALFHHTGGHPLFTVELLRAMQERGDLVRDTDSMWTEEAALDWEKLPARVEAVIELRVSRLDPELREIISVASVEGEVFTAQVVAAVQKMAERPLLRRLAQELAGQHSLVREQEEVQINSRRLARYRFGHILVQSYLYQRLSRGERQLLHGQVAATLENLYQGQLDEVAVQLAHHFHQAGDDGRAFQYFTRAAENAARMYANDEAIMHYTRAIEIAGRISWEVAVAQAYRGRGLAYETLGEFELARADHETALKVARAAGERRAEWRVLLDLGKLWASRDYEQTRRCFEQALELARRIDDPAVLAGSLNRIGNWHANAEDLPAAIAYHREALAILEQLGDRRGLATTLDLLGIASLLAGDMTAAAEYYDRAIALFRELDDRPSLASSLTGRGHAGGTAACSLAVLSAATPLDAQRDFQEAMHIAQDIGSPAGEAWVLWSLGLLNMVQGQFGQAWEAVQRGLGIASEIGHREWIVGNRTILGILYVEWLAPQEARRQLEPALVLAQELQSQHWIHQITGALATAYCLLDDLAGAQSCLETVLSPGTPMDTLHKRYCWARRAELALFQGDPALALEIVERLIASAPGKSPGRVITFLWKLKGEALCATGHSEEACALLQAAIEHARATGERFLLWRVHASLGRLYGAMNRRSEAETEFSTARKLAEELADTIPDEALKDNFVQRAYSALKSLP